MIVTIDGPAGAGKSSSAKELARRLGFEFLDTGAMYRAVTWAALRAGANLSDEDALRQLMDGLRLEMPPGRVILNGEDVTGPIRAGAVTAASGAVADSPVVRARLGEMQRQIAAGRDMVTEGRDQGTVIFADAECKFFLFADPDERARRRQRDMAGRGENVPWDEVLKAQELRDSRDCQRKIAPMIPAPDAVLLDSTELSMEQVVELMESEVHRRRKKKDLQHNVDNPQAER